MLNIGIVCYPTFGGSGVVATELGKALAAKGYKVHFISYSQPARLDFFNENIFYHEVTVSNYPLFEYPPYESALTGKLVDIVKHHNLDVLHVHYAVPHASAALLAKEILREEGINIPVITTLHGTDITLVGKDANYEPVVCHSIRNSDAVTAVSESLQKQTLETFHLNKDIRVIYNFIDFDRFNKTPREHFRKAIAPKGEFLIAHTSNFRKVKRVDDVILTFSKIYPHIPAKLLLIGDGPERTRLENYARTLCGAEHVLFLGKVEAVEEILSVCDLFFLTSESESFGLSALEAMACEVPVISTNAGGIPEVNIHGETGFMAEVGDVDSMAAYALELLNDNAKLKQFRKNALAQAQRFSLDNILPEYMDLYEEVTKKNKTATKGSRKKEKV